MQNDWIGENKCVHVRVTTIEGHRLVDKQCLITFIEHMMHAGRRQHCPGILFSGRITIIFGSL